MQKESKRIDELGELYKDKKDGLQKLIEGQEVQKKGELYWKEKCLDSQAQLPEVQKHAQHPTQVEKIDQRGWGW